MRAAVASCWRCIVALLLALSGVAGGIRPAHAALPVVSPVDLTLDGPGTNVDDSCFWSDPADPSRALLFVTTKGVAGLVEVWELPGGTLVGIIPGFETQQRIIRAACDAR